MGDNTDFASGSTFAGTPAGCAAAIRTLQIFERDHIVAHAKRLGKIAAGTMRKWEECSIVRQTRGNGLLLGVSFGKPESADGDEEDWWTARAVRGKMLENGVWAISDRQDTIRMYPALNMEESVLRKGLQIMEDAIRHVEKHGHSEGDAMAYPAGVGGF
jgi:acetylornithine/succinyldiaminopimelate/putrescine aminotransferase